MIHKLKGTLLQKKIVHKLQVWKATSTLIRPQVSNPKFFSNIIKANKRQRKDDTSSASGQLIKFGRKTEAGRRRRH